MESNRPKLDLLIAHLENERKLLKRMIKEASAEHDNLIVYYHSEALLELNLRLNVFYNFRDPYFNKKEELKRKINFSRKNEFIDKFSPRVREFMKQLYEDEAKELEKDLQKLKDLPTVPLPPEGKKFEKALFDLYDEQYRAFEIVLGEDSYYTFRLVFQIKKKILTVELTGNFYDEEPDFVLENRIPQPIKAAGFEYNEQRKKYTRSFDIAGFKNVGEIKMWFAKFIIEDTWIYSSGGKMRLEYKTRKK